MPEVIVVPDIETPDVIVTDNQNPSNILVNDENVNIYEETKDGTSDIFTAGESLNPGMLVYSLLGKVYRFQATDPTLYHRKVGFAMNLASTNAAVRVKWSGHFSISGWALTPDVRYFAGINGLIVPDITVVAGLRIVLPVGVTINAEKLFIDFGTSYLLRV